METSPCGRAVQLFRELAGGLVVHADSMRQNLEATGDSVLSEARANPEIAARLTPVELDELFDMSRHVGQCMALVDRLPADVP